QLGLFYLIEDVELQLRIDVAEEDVLGVAEFFGDAWLEVGEDTEPCLERLAAIEVVGVARLPAERLARLPLHVRQVHAARRQFLEMIFGKVGARRGARGRGAAWSEEHTSELQLRVALVFP